MDIYEGAEKNKKNISVTTFEWKNLTEMIVLRLKGRLGNQMFEYAAANSIAKLYNDKLCIYKFELDIIYRDTGYKLGDLKIDKNSKYLLIPITLYLRTLKDIVNRILKRLNLKTFISKNEIGIKNNIEIISHKRDKFEIKYDYSKKYHVIEGFWQNPLYFDKYRDKIIKMYKPSFKLSTTSTSLINEIESTYCSVSIHIRRGDYSKIGWCLSMDYYKKALELIERKFGIICKYYIFSDDIAWAKSNLTIDNCRTLYVNHDSEKQPFEDIWVMSKCQTNIIANSSFSWWAGYLNTKRNKMVIAPEIMRRTHDKYCIPNDWIVID